MKIKLNFLLLFLFFFIFLIYISHLSNAVFGGDTGDFLTAVAVQGVAHPSGYPVIILLGLLFKHLPIDATLAWKVGLISSIASVVSVYFFFRSSLLLTKNTLISLISASTLAFLYPFWLHAEIAEVFALAYMFHIILLYLTLRYVYKKEQKTLYLISIFSGLALANHQIVISFLPVIFLTLLWVNFRIFLRLKTLLYLIGLFIIGLSPYLYIFFAPNHNYPINWGYEENLMDILKYILRLDYGWSPHIAIETSVRMFHLSSYFNYLLKEMTSVVVGLSILGLFYLLFSKKIIYFIFILSSYLFIGPMFIIYASVPSLNFFTLHVYERFYVFSFIFLLLFFSVGMTAFIDSVDKFVVKKFLKKIKSKNLLSLFAGVFLIIPLSLFVKNYQLTNFSNVWLGENVYEDLLETLPRGSSLYSDYDSIMFNIHYLQQVKLIRRDVVVEDHLRNKRKDTNFMAKYDYVSKNYKGLRPSDRLLMTYKEMGNNSAFFSDTEFQFDFPAQKKYGKINWIPYGLVNKLATDEEISMTEIEFFEYQKDLWDNFRIGKNYKYPKAADYNFTLLDIKYLYGLSATRVADYIRVKYMDEEKAVYFDKKALEISPYIFGSYKKIIDFESARKNCKEASYFIGMYDKYNFEANNTSDIREGYDKYCKVKS